jgi:hypothetical protein
MHLKQEPLANMREKGSRERIAARKFTVPYSTNTDFPTANHQGAAQYE